LTDLSIHSNFAGANCSDTPIHHDLDHPNTILQTPVPQETQPKIPGENAMRFLKVEMEAS